MVTPRIDGTDTSHWNTITDYDKAFSHPLASLKASEGKFYKDYTFGPRWAAMRERNVKYRGAYHWVRPDFTIADQAANLIRVIEANDGLLKGEFLQTDWEVTYKNGIDKLPVPTSTQIAEFNDRLRQHFSRQCVITYSSDWLPDSTLDADSRREFLEWRDENPTEPLWFANYNTSDRATGGWAESDKFNADVWQWSSTQFVPGWAAGIDVNHVFNWQALDLVSNQLVIPEPEPLIIPEDPVIYVFIRPLDPEFEFEPGKFGLFTQDGHPVTGEYVAALQAAGAKVSIVDQPAGSHVWWKEATLHKMGEAARRAYGDTPAG